MGGRTVPRSSAAARSHPPPRHRPRHHPWRTSRYARCSFARFSHSSLLARNRTEKRPRLLQREPAECLSGGLLLVSLHFGHRAGDRALRALPELPLRPALAQQVPALVKRLFGGTKPLPLLYRAQLSPLQLPPQFVLR